MNKIVKGEIEKILSETVSNDKIVPLKNEQRYIVTIDENGNIKGYFHLKDKHFGKEWLALFQNPARWIAKQKMTGDQSNVLWFLLSQLDFDNYLRVSRQDIADELEIDPSRVSRAMRVLKEKSIIVEGPPAGKFKTYRLNPYIGHKGKNRKETILDFEDSLAKQGKNVIDASKVFEFE